MPRRRRGLCEFTGKRTQTHTDANNSCHSQLIPPQQYIERGKNNTPPPTRMYALCARCWTTRARWLARSRVWRQKSHLMHCRTLAASRMDSGTHRRCRRMSVSVSLLCQIRYIKFYGGRWRVHFGRNAVNVGVEEKGIYARFARVRSLADLRNRRTLSHVDGHCTSYMVAILQCWRCCINCGIFNGVGCLRSGKQDKTISTRARV